MSSRRSSDGPPAFTAELVGIPYRLGGRDQTGVDCYGAARLAIRAGLGIDMPPYALAPDVTHASDGRVKRKIIAGLLTERWRRVTEGEGIEPFDLGFYRDPASGLYHLWLYVGDGWAFESCEPVGTRNERVDEWRRSQSRFYRRPC